MSKRVVHFSSNRHLSIEEAKRIGSFGDLYKMAGSFSNQWQRIGNSVPPLLMEAIARHVKENILDMVST